MRILVHDYAGHPFQVQLSRELARRGHEVRHAYASALQTPRGELVKREDSIVVGVWPSRRLRAGRNTCSTLRALEKRYCLRKDA